MIYLDYKNVAGRMCNHFYYALQCHILQKKTNEEVRYITQQHCYDNHVDDRMRLFNTFFIAEDMNIPHKTTYNSSKSEWGMYHQLFNQDFNNDNLKEFIEDTFLKTNLFTPQENDNVIAIHMRLGDYMQSTISNCFDKKAYIERCFEHIDSKIDTVKLFSDSIDVAKNILVGTNIPFNFKLVFSDNKTDTEDFIELATMKNKILWNSTFSYWSAFISNILYPNSYNRIYAPVKFSSREPDNNHNDPKWNCL